MSKADVALKLALEKVFKNGHDTGYEACQLDAKALINPRIRFARTTDKTVTQEYLEWLASIQPREGVGGNEAWNAGVEWALRQRRCSPEREAQINAALGIEQPAQRQDPAGYKVTGKLGDICTFHSAAVKKGDTVYASAHQSQPLTTEQYTAIAHRIASRYQHRSDPTTIAYTFLPHTLEQFVRELEAAIKEKNA